MDLEVYDLAPDYGELFRDKTRGSKEVIFSVAHSSDLELDENGKPTTQAIGSFIARSAGGTHNAQPSWELLAVYEMTNGKTIDEPGSGFDPHDPFANRDPRCLETFAAPGSRIYGIEWNPAAKRTRNNGLYAKSYELQIKIPKAVRMLPTVLTMVVACAKARKNHGVLLCITTTLLFSCVMPMSC